MTNSESLGAESATEPTTKPEQDALNMSAGAEMLIARMKTNPEDFRYNGRFYRVVGAIDAAGQGWISARDAVALKAAYEEHIQEAEFSEWVYNEIFSPKEEPLQNRYAQHLGQSMMASKNAIAGQMLQGNWTDPKVLYGSPLQGAAMWNGTVPSSVAVAHAEPRLSESMLSQIKTKLGL